MEISTPQNKLFYLYFSLILIKVSSYLNSAYHYQIKANHYIDFWIIQLDIFIRKLLRVYKWNETCCLIGAHSAWLNGTAVSDIGIIDLRESQRQMLQVANAFYEFENSNYTSFFFIFLSLIDNSLFFLALPIYIFNCNLCIYAEIKKDKASHKLTISYYIKYLVLDFFRSVR